MTSKKTGWFSKWLGRSEPTTAASAIEAPSAFDAVVMDAKQKVRNGQALLVDVREQSEWDAGHVNHAVLFPLSQLKILTDAAELERTLPRNKLIFTYCVMGKRSTTAAEILVKFGYQAQSLPLNFKQLTDAGFEIPNPTSNA